jgi:hypothetical protein
MTTLIRDCGFKAKPRWFTVYWYDPDTDTRKQFVVQAYSYRDAIDECRGHYEGGEWTAIPRLTY